MATKKSIVQLLAVFCLSVLTVALTARVSTAGAPVTVTNTASNPVPTQNVGGGAATHVGQPASSFVNLICDFANAPATGLCKTRSGSFTVPNGEALIVTDAEFSGFVDNTFANKYVFLDLEATEGSNPITVVSSIDLSTLADTAGHYAGQLHLTTGWVVPPGGSIFGVGAGTIFDVQGYLVPNQ